MSKVLITAKTHPYLIDHLKEKGYQVLYHPAISYEEAYQLIHECAGLVVTTRIPVDRRLIDRGIHLQWIARLGSGMELIDVAYATSKGIRCVSSPEGNADAVGEHAVGMLVALLRHFRVSYDQLKEGIWEREKNRGYEIGGKVVGIIGYGHTGSAFARKLSGFGATILAYDKYKTGFGNEYVQEVSLETIFRQADIVSLHVPLTEETHHMVNRRFIHSFTTPVYLINTSRGAVVDTHDLVEALKEERIAGACLDVLENERIDQLTDAEREDFQYLLHHPRVIITPHIAGYTHEASLKMAQVVLHKLGI
ncbi:NAD(P)-dependent oxidoreductase [Thermoflavifilum thermophilum]|uniref:D-3-phosphoglycerate dehydrogenase n=1 Tax=Thermoflavifilum thermophilum TaxID=1393122 RepID=A0A1I7N5B6_9BACT|nr:NAD(P)-dependent oxidoreductase [Thermoflavifilum thermophilum]SFV29835.1 D-3-phosphoglycerate dehydrogenase [Thermoflavifilum thermophilum]